MSAAWALTRQPTCAIDNLSRICIAYRGDGCESPQIKLTRRVFLSALDTGADINPGKTHVGAVFVVLCFLVGFSLLTDQLRVLRRSQREVGFSSRELDPDARPDAQSRRHVMT